MLGWAGDRVRVWMGLLPPICHSGRAWGSDCSVFQASTQVGGTCDCVDSFLGILVAPRTEPGNCLSKGTDWVCGIHFPRLTHEASGLLCSYLHGSLSPDLTIKCLLTTISKLNSSSGKLSPRLPPFCFLVSLLPLFILSLFSLLSCFF